MKLRHLPLMLAFASVFAFAADPAVYRQSLAAGKALLEKGDAAAASRKLQEATVADPGQYEGYFYLAIAAYRGGQLSAAEEYARLALERAPEADAARVREMIVVIGEKRDFERLEREGNEAFADGLIAKAAESYRKAYLLFPNQGAVGLRAAELYAEHLNRPMDAAVLWQKVITLADEDSSTAARLARERHSDVLAKLAAEQFAAAKKAGDTQALVRLTEAFPDNPDHHFELAVLYARARELDHAVGSLKSAIKAGLALDAVRRNEALQDLVFSQSEDGVFARFVADAFGAEVEAEMRSAASARQTAQLVSELTEWALGYRQSILDEINATLRSVSGYRVRYAWPAKKNRYTFQATTTFEFDGDGLTYDRGSGTYGLRTIKKVRHDYENPMKDWSSSLQRNSYRGYQFAHYTEMKVSPEALDGANMLGARFSSSIGPNAQPIQAILVFAKPGDHGYRTTHEAGSALVPSPPSEGRWRDFPVIPMILPDDERVLARLRGGFERLRSLDQATPVDLLHLKRSAGE